MGTVCACAPLILRTSSDSRPSAHCPSPGAGLNAPRQRPQHPVHDDVGREENGRADVCLHLTDHRRTAEYELKVVTLGLIGDVLPRRGRRFPPDDWGTTSVIWRTSKFRAPNAVPDSVRRPHSATVKADQDQHSPMKPGGRRRRRPRASSTGAIGHVPAGYSTSLGRYWPGVVRTARTPAPRGVHPALPQQLPLLVHCVRVRPGPQW